MKKNLQKALMFALTLSAFSAFSAHLKPHMLLTARMDGAQEVPAVSGNGVGLGSLLLNPTRDTLCINITFNSLSGSPSGLHIHQGAVGVSGPVILDLSSFIVGNRLVATITGTALTATLKSNLLKGLTYLNLHTAANPGGEIRGQILLESDKAYTGTLNGAQQVPAVTTTANGYAVFNVAKHQGTVKFYVTANGLSGAITGAHIHVGAAGTTGGVIQDLSTFISGNTITGAFTPSAGVLTALSAGNAYINIHTAANPNGEIRAQLRGDDKLAFDSWLDGAQEVPSVTTAAKGVASVKFNTTLDTLFFNVNTTGLSGAITGAHLHNAALGVAGPVALDLTFGINGNVVSGIVTGAGLNTAFTNSLLSGGIYLNIHTSANPNGEIRGQVYRVMREGFTFSMDGSQQVPAVSSPGQGSGIITINRDQDNAHYMLVTSGVTSTGIHLHKGLPGVSGPVIFDLTPYYSNNSAFGYWKSTDSSPFLVSNSTQFNKDSIYVNLHTSANPNGEIRGNIFRGFRCYSIVTGIESNDALSENAISIYPNPSTNGNFNVSFVSSNDAKTLITVYHVLGKQVYTSANSAKQGTNNFNVNLNDAAKGIYFIKLSTQGNSITKKIIIE